MNRIIEFVKNELKFDHSGHNFQHIERVVKNAEYLIKYEGGNSKIIITACYLHDVIDEKLFDDIPNANEFVSNLNDHTGNITNRKFDNNVLKIVYSEGFKITVFPPAIAPTKGSIRS